MIMKKLVTVFALCAAVSAYAQVESANIVGYTSKTATGTYYSSGASFISVGSITDEWKLSDIVLTGSVPVNDFIQFLSPIDANVVFSATYVNLAAAKGNQSLVGWYDMNGEIRLDDTVFPAGTAFLANFASANVGIVSSGQVLTDSVTLDCSGLNYPFVVNVLPKQITLGDITLTGSVPVNDFIQILNSTDANVEFSATYVNLAAAKGNQSLVGWYDMNGEIRLDDTIIEIGAAFLGNFASTGVGIVFPAAI
jgi:hypothetical protein